MNYANILHFYWGIKQIKQHFYWGIMLRIAHFYWGRWNIIYRTSVLAGAGQAFRMC